MKSFAHPFRIPVRALGRCAFPAAPVPELSAPQGAPQARHSSLALGVGFFVLLSLVFVPFDRSRHSLPVWFRARWFVPALFLLWSLIGSKFPFSPHQLTHVLPAFLLGHPETLADLNDDLRDFLLNNRSSIEGLIQEASAGMGELY